MSARTWAAPSRPLTTGLAAPSRRFAAGLVAPSRRFAAGLAAPSRRFAAGFTLIEVLVALAIVAITLGAGMRAAGALSGNADRLAQVSAAQWCADNELTGLRLAHRLPDVGDADFSCEQLGRSYPGHLRTRPTPNPNFRRVDAIVADDAGHPLVTLSTVMARF